MKLYKVKLNAWTSPVWVNASNQSKAKELALQHFPTCDCCGAVTAVEGIEQHTGATPHHVSIIMEVKKA